VIRRVMRAGAVLALGAAGLLFDASFSGATPVPGTVQVWGTPGIGDGGPNTAEADWGGTVVLTGAIGDHGRAVNASPSGKQKKNGTYTLLLLMKGSILLNTTQLNKQLNDPSLPYSWNAVTCSGNYYATDPVSVVSGTKFYAGVSGSVNVTAAIAFVDPLQKGKCNNGQNSPNPSALYTSVSGTGNVRF
jgi:hypothetical protein